LYGFGKGDLGHNERLPARALRRCGGSARAHIVTKGGMTRVGGGRVPDDRAKALRADCEANLTALGGLPIDPLPDPSARPAGLAGGRRRARWERLLADGLARHVVVSNVNRRLLDEALALAGVAAALRAR
jgi:aryl-alcohol dehydrogenase-like predicted oxidoreductase